MGVHDVRGTPTERIEILMSIGRNTKVDAKDRINAVLAAAELEGERRPGRVKAGPPAPIVAPMAPPIAPKGKPALSLVMSEADQELA